MPWSRIGRSTSTTPWSKSISITRSATMHSRPIETCWKQEIVHSWPSTVLAPISHSPSWTRIFVPWPIHDQRPRRSTASRPISSFTPGPMKQMPSVCRRARNRSLSHARRANRRAYRWLSIPCERRNRRSSSGPPRSGSGARRTFSGLGGLVTVAMRSILVSAQLLHPVDLDGLIGLDVPDQAVELGLHPAVHVAKLRDHRQGAPVVADHPAEEQAVEPPAVRRLELGELGLGQHARHQHPAVAVCVLAGVGHLLAAGLQPFLHQLDLALLRGLHALREQPDLAARAALRHVCGHLERLGVVVDHALHELDVGGRGLRLLGGSELVA